MKEVEINKNREDFILSFPWVDFDKPYTFYYDETNNFRKFYIRESGFNFSFNSNFILGGLVFETKPLNLNELFKGLKLDKSLRDVKLKHLSKGSFLECLNSEKINYFLQYLFDKKVLIHFTWVNLLHWATADIVDSAVANSTVAKRVGRDMLDRVRSDLYKLAKYETNAMVNLFYKYQYPNIKKESIISFIEDLIFLFADYINTKEFHFGLEALRQVLEEAKENKSLPFLTNEEDYILVKDFSSFYLSPICLYRNSNHIFDNEELVSRIISNTKLMDGNNEVKNYSFVDSHSNLITQASDIFVGILGKLSIFLNTNSYTTVHTAINSLTEMQKSSIDIIIDLIDHSFESNPGFQVIYDCQEETDKFHLIRKLRDK